jgi:hypothetical protein
MQRDDQTYAQAPCITTEMKGRTNPYCPPVLAMPLDDAQFIVESGEELPAGSGKKRGDEIMCDTVREGPKETIAKDCEGSHENPIHKVPELC